VPTDANPTNLVDSMRLYRFHQYHKANVQPVRSLTSFGPVGSILWFLAINL
jgi:hypothetical protein